MPTGELPPTPGGALLFRMDGVPADIRQFPLFEQRPVPPKLRRLLEIAWVLGPVLTVAFDQAADWSALSPGRDLGS